MSQHRKARGMRTQLLVAEHLRTHGWPHAQSAGAGRSGVDVLETPDIAVEVKARTDLSPLAWVKQAEKSADGRLPFAVFRCNGQGEDATKYLAMLRFGDLVQLLREAGYGDTPIDGPASAAPVGVNVRGGVGARESACDRPDCPICATRNALQTAHNESREGC